MSSTCGYIYLQNSITDPTETIICHKAYLVNTTTIAVNVSLCPNHSNIGTHLCIICWSLPIKNTKLTKDWLILFVTTIDAETSLSISISTISKMVPRDIEFSSRSVLVFSILFFFSNENSKIYPVDKFSMDPIFWCIRW